MTEKQQKILRTATKNVDFNILDKLWTDEERKEVSAFIKLRKEQHKK